MQLKWILWPYRKLSSDLVCALLVYFLFLGNDARYSRWTLSHCCCQHSEPPPSVSRPFVLITDELMQISWSHSCGLHDRQTSTLNAKWIGISFSFNQISDPRKFCRSRLSGRARWYRRNFHVSRLPILAPSISSMAVNRSNFPEHHAINAKGTNLKR